MKMLKEGTGLMTSIDMYVLTCLKLGKQERAKQIGQIYYQIASMLKIPGVNPYSALLTLALEAVSYTHLHRRTPLRNPSDPVRSTMYL